VVVTDVVGETVDSGAVDVGLLVGLVGLVGLVVAPVVVVVVTIEADDGPAGVVVPSSAHAASVSPATSSSEAPECDGRLRVGLHIRGAG